MIVAMTMLAFQVQGHAAGRCGTTINTGDAGRASDPSVVAIASDAAKRRKLLACDATGLDAVAKKGFSLSEAALSDPFDSAMFNAVKAGRQRDVATAIHANALENAAGSQVDAGYKARWQADWCAAHASPRMATLEPPDAPNHRALIRQLDKKTIELVRHIATDPLRKDLRTCNASVAEWIERVRGPARP